MIQMFTRQVFSLISSCLQPSGKDRQEMSPQTKQSQAVISLKKEADKSCNWRSTLNTVVKWGQSEKMTSEWESKGWEGGSFANLGAPSQAEAQYVARTEGRK